MGNATTVPDASMTRREFVGWMLASVAAMVAGSRVWRLFRGLAERGEAYGVVTEIDRAHGTITVEYPTMASLSKAYRRTMGDLYRAYTQPVLEYDWIAFA